MGTKQEETSPSSVLCRRWWLQQPLSMNPVVFKILLSPSCNLVLSLDYSSSSLSSHNCDQLYFSSWLLSCMPISWGGVGNVVGPIPSSIGLHSKNNSELSSSLLPYSNCNSKPSSDDSDYDSDYDSSSGILLFRQHFRCHRAQIACIAYIVYNNEASSHYPPPPLFTDTFGIRMVDDVVPRPSDCRRLESCPAHIRVQWWQCQRRQGGDVGKDQNSDLLIAPSTNVEDVFEYSVLGSEDLIPVYVGKIQIGLVT